MNRRSTRLSDRSQSRATQPPCAGGCPCQRPEHAGCNGIRWSDGIARSIANRKGVKGMSMSLSVTDWSRSRGAAEFVDLDGATTVSELLAEAREALRLPRDGEYSLIRGNEKLARTATLDDLGIQDRETLEISPEVSAG